MALFWDVLQADESSGSSEPIGEESIIDSQSDEDGMMEEMLKILGHRCNETIAQYENLTGLYCPPIFDGWSCWNATAAGSIATGPCPYFITGFDPKRTAHKLCTEDGTWYRHPQSNVTWSNYTTCVDVEDLEMRQVIISVYIAGYSISLVALILSLAIFCIFRSLKCTRIQIHRNLFASFIINNALWLLWYKAVADKPHVLIQNGLACKMLHIVLHYFMVSNYFWMFCEGLYLHTLLVVTFVAEEAIMKWFYLIGWVIPAVFTTVYAAVRASIPQETNLCWIEESRSTWVLSVPVCLSMLANAFFLVNIVRVLITKLKAPSTASTNFDYQPTDGTGTGTAFNGSAGTGNNQKRNRSDSRLPGGVRSPSSMSGLRKAVRATLILLPLLGLHYVVTPFRPDPGAPGEIVYQIVSAVCTSFQGYCVAFLFCFANGEVLQVLRKALVRYAISRKAPNLNRRFSVRSQRITTEL